jgi:hypothetical protein
MSNINTGINSTRESPASHDANIKNLRPVNAPAPVRRSLRIGNATPDEIGQHCRSGQLSDLLGEISLGAAVARHFLDIEADEEALALIERLIGNVREMARTAKVFRDVHARRGAASYRAAIHHAETVHAAERVAVAMERDAS